MSRLSELQDQIEECRATLRARNDDLDVLSRELAPYWAARKAHTNAILATMRTREDNRTGQLHCLGYEGRRVVKPSQRWVGPADPAKGGHVEPCERLVIEVEGSDIRRDLHNSWIELHDEFRPLLKVYKELRMEIDAEIRIMNRLQQEVDKIIDRQRKVRQFSLFEEAMK